MNILVVGATGNLGRQVVRRAIDEGHTVRCMVRNRERALFLEQWGAQLFQGDLREPDSFAPVLGGIEGVVLAASALANRDYRDKTNSIEAVDDRGTRAFIDVMAKTGVQHVVYTSILRADEFPSVRMMATKHAVEKHLEQSGLTYTILRLCGFMQGIIPEYALPILEKKPIRVPRTPSPMAYISTLDAARFVVAAFATSAARNRTFGLSGPETWNPQQLIDLCDELAKVKQVPKVSILSEGQKRINEMIAKFFNPNLIDLLRFSEVFATGKPYEADMDAVGEIFEIPPASLTAVDPFMREYFAVIKRRLREKNYQEPKVRSPF